MVAVTGRVRAAVTAGWSRLTARGPGGRPAALLELVGLLLWFAIFSRLHAALGRDPVVATANAATVQAIDRAMHVDVVLGMNRWLAGHQVAGQLAMYFYRLYYLVILGVLLWVFLRHAGAYRRVRRTMIAMTVLVLPVYWMVPLSPPRFALAGTVDIVAVHDVFSSAAGTGPSHYTAMPSMHVGWSLWCAYAVWSVLRVTRPRRALLPWLFPLLMAVDVLATANHYVLDIVGSAALLALALGAAAMWGRLTGRRTAGRDEAATPQPGR